MGSNLESFHYDFLQRVHASAGADRRFTGDAFFELFCAELIEAGDLETADRHYYSNDRDLRVDGYSGDPSGADGILTRLICDFPGEPSIKTLTRAGMVRSFNHLSKFLRDSLDQKFRNALDETLPGYALAELIASRWDEINKVRLILITDRVLSKRVDGTSDGEVDSVPVSHSVWDISRLQKFADAGHGREEIEVDLVRDFDGPIPMLAAHASNAPYEAFLAVVPGAQLAAIYDRWGARLLEQNVRVFLQARGNVNKGIKVTLENDPDMFFAYNNGLTATAEGIETKRSDDGLYLTSLSGFQIVNGGQTTASIHAASRRGIDLSNVYVQMKLSIVSPQDVTAIIPKISEYANTQNKVNAADFFSNHPFHVRIEEFSRRLYAKSSDGGIKDTKWFYERARGQYEDARSLLNVSARKRFDLEFPKRQVFLKTDLAKYLMVWNGEPHTVSRGAQKNFVRFAERIGSDWEQHANRYNEVYFKHAVAKMITFRYLEKAVSAQSWYQGGYRANIVAYAIAKLAHEVERSGYSVDFDRVWNEQAVSTPLGEALVTCAEQVNTVISNPPSGARNVTEWAKQQACWKRVQDLQFSMPNGWVKALVPASTQAELVKDAERVQKIDNEIADQTRVVEIGGPKWAEIGRWAKERGLLSPDEAGILDVCARIPRNVPTAAQCSRAVAVLARVQNEGCTVVMS